MWITDGKAEEMLSKTICKLLIKEKQEEKKQFESSNDG